MDNDTRKILLSIARSLHRMDNNTQKILLLIARSLHRIERAISQGHPAEDCNTDSTEIKASLDRLLTKMPEEEKKNG